VTTRTVRISVLVFIGVLAMLAVSAMLATLMTDRPPLLPTHGEAPAFELTNQHGETLTNKDLQGHLWIADFAFTRCKTICPVLTANMMRIQNWLEKQPGANNMRLVTFSVNPEHDTPEVLRAFAQNYDVNFDRWDFVTAENREAIWSMMEEGFKLPVGANPDNAMMPINHSAKMVLIDKTGDIRGYYAGTKARGLENLKQDVKQLLNTSP